MFSGAQGSVARVLKMPGPVVLWLLTINKHMENCQRPIKQRFQSILYNNTHLSNPAAMGLDLTHNDQSNSILMGKNAMPVSVPKKIAFWLYNRIWALSIPFLRYNHRLAEGFSQRTLTDFPENGAELWIQAASVGEAFLAVELINKLELDKPLRIRLTSNTRQGLEILKQASEKFNSNNDAIQAEVTYFPFDQPAIMRAAVHRTRPRVMVLLETEVWPGLLSALKASDCKILIINGRITKKSLSRYLLWPTFWQSLCPDYILAISETDAMRFARLFGTEDVGVMPNIKFDRIKLGDAVGKTENPVDNLLPTASPFVVLGSVRQKEEPLIEKLISYIFDYHPETVFGLFPRHKHRISHWEQRLMRLRIPYGLRSNTEAAVGPGTVLLWDMFGELAPAYELSCGAFVGGSLVPLGGQNFLEALTCGIVPVIGPSWENFSWVGPQIFEQGLVRIANDWREAAQMLMEDIKNPRPPNEVLNRALLYLKERQGGTNQACRQIEAFLNMA
jgi:3-deoxy-D-manno-octulosonic-acid transferase